MFVTMKSHINLKLGHVGSNSWSLDQILEKLCLHSKGFILIFMKRFQNVYLYEI